MLIGCALRYCSETTNFGLALFHKLLQDLHVDFEIWLQLKGAGQWTSRKPHTGIITQLGPTGGTYVREMFDKPNGFIDFLGRLVKPDFDAEVEICFVDFAAQRACSC